MNKVIPMKYSSNARRSRHTIYDTLMRYAEFLGYGELHTKIDEETGLKAIIAIHNLKRGPAIGGARFVTYPTTGQAVEDALRLGYMMSYKAAINNLPHGGGKAVLIKPKEIKNREAYFEKFGEFVNELGGRYITAVDSGTSPIEMDIIARRTPFVTCTTKSGADSDPSPFTALGVRRAIEAAVKFKFNKDSLEGIHIAIQGAGHVGYNLAKEVISLGAIVTMADINQNTLQRCVNDLSVKVTSPEEILRIKSDVLAPCALGAVLNRESIKHLNTKIVAGAANNQLAHYQYGLLLHERDILYAPDFLINAGGLIHVAVLYDHGNIQKSMEQINNIYNIVYGIFEKSQLDNCSTNEIAHKIAKDRLK